MPQGMILCCSGILFVSGQLPFIQAQSWPPENRTINSCVCVHMFCGHLKGCVGFVEESLLQALSLGLQGQLCGTVSFACGLCDPL